MDVETRSGRVDIALKQRPKSEVVAFGKLMAALAMMKSREDMGQFQVEVYEDRTVSVPLNVLVLAVQRLVDAGGWRPGPGELLQACGKVGAEMREAMRYDPSDCEQCDGSGWEKIKDGNVIRERRCGCWKRHQAKVAQIAGSIPLALPAGSGDEAA